MMRIESTNLSEVRDYFDVEVPDEIDSVKQRIANIGREFAQRVRNVNVPIGPPKRGKDSPYHEGSLRESVEDYQNTGRDDVEARVTVGGGTDYVWYVAARTGVDFFRGADDAEDAIERVLRGAD